MSKPFNSKTKGDNYERKLAKILTKYWGEPFHRVPQSGGLHWGASQNEGDSRVTGDIIPSMGAKFPFSVEAKHREGGWTIESVFLNKHDIRNWWSQSVNDASKVGLVPLLLFTRNYADDFAMLPYEPKTFYKVMNNNYPVMVTIVTYQDPVTDVEHSYLTMVTTLDGFMSVEKEHYIETFYQNDQWKETEVFRKGEAVGSLQDQAGDILDMMFGED